MRHQPQLILKTESRTSTGRRKFTEKSYRPRHLRELALFADMFCADMFCCTTKRLMVADWRRSLAEWILIGRKRESLSQPPYTLMQNKRSRSINLQLHWGASSRGVRSLRRPRQRAGILIALNSGRSQCHHKSQGYARALPSGSTRSLIPVSDFNQDSA